MSNRKVAIAAGVASLIGVACAASLASFALAQAITVHRVLPTFSGPTAPSTPARLLFARASRPSVGVDRSIGFYSNGCLVGAAVMPLSGPTWQVMRPSRNRFYGRARLIGFLQRYSESVAQATSWPGILLGDLSQPQGGPMAAGHISHQTGLDADIWLRPMERVPITREARETQMSLVVVNDTGKAVAPSWTADHLTVMRLAASDPEVDRVLVNPAIKRALCETATGDRTWLKKIRPMYGHDYHMHVRLRCLEGEQECRSQPPIGDGDGCGADVNRWVLRAAAVRRPPDAQPISSPSLRLGAMPEQCVAMISHPHKSADR